MSSAYGVNHIGAPIKSLFGHQLRVKTCYYYDFFLHFVANSLDMDDRVYKTQPILDHFNTHEEQLLTEMIDSFLWFINPLGNNIFHPYICIAP